MNKLKKFLICSMSAVMVAVCSVPVASAIVKASNTPVWTEADFAEEYIVSDTLNIPARELSIGGTEYASTIKMTYPDGETKSISAGDMTLSMPGCYSIIYETRDENKKRYTDTVEFFVANKLWSATNSKTEVEYGKVGNTDALLVRLAKNDTLTFNKVIDLNDPSFDKFLVGGFINPNAVGSNDFEKLIFKFTDAYDPTQTMTVRANKSSGTVNANCVSYWTAAGSSQTLGGYDSVRGGFVNNNPDGICGTARSVSFCSQKGTWVSSNVPYKLENVTADKEWFKIHFDAENLRLMVEDRGGHTTEVTDFDNPSYYTAEPLWNGFPSGKVILSITADGYAAETANFGLSSVFSYDLSVENRFVEEDAPEITVDVDEQFVYEKNGNYFFKPLAVVGGNYPVPTATAFDAYSGNLKVTTKVYSNATGTNKVEVKVNNGTFEVKAATTYAIEYTATDYMGNQQVNVYYINAVNALDTPLTLTVNMKDALTSGVCGEQIILAPYTTTGGSGDYVTMNITATCGDEVVDVTKGVFVAEKAGVWTIKYLAKDFSGIVEEFEYTIDVEWGTKPVFVELPTLPKYIVSGMGYVVPTVLANDYSTGTKVQKVADLVVEDANGTATYKAGEKYTPKATEANPIVKLIFSVDGATLPVEIPAVTPLTEKNGRISVAMEKMFVGEGYTQTRDKTGLTLLAAGNKDFTWTFANAVVAQNARLKIKGLGAKSLFEGVNVTFTDYENDEIAVTMTIVHDADGTARVKFGNTDRKMLKGLSKGTSSTGDALDELTFSYKLGAFYVDAIEVKVAKDDNGNAFNGFPSGRVYVSSTTIGAEKGEGYIIKEIDNNAINAGTTDKTPPKIGINGEYGGMYAINSLYVVTTALASDTLDPDVKCTVTVSAPNGDILTDESGVFLKDVPADREYTVKLTQYGQFIVLYTASDWNNKEATTSTTSYAVNVFDRKAPTAKIEGEWSATAKVGDTVALPAVSISDDASSIEEMRVYRYVRNPNNVVCNFGYDYTVKNGEIVYNYYKFTFRFAGTYRFVIVVYDAAGNQKTLQYLVTVE